MSFNDRDPQGTKVIGSDPSHVGHLIVWACGKRMSHDGEGAAAIATQKRQKIDPCRGLHTRQSPDALKKFRVKRVALSFVRSRCPHADRQDVLWTKAEVNVSHKPAALDQQTGSDGKNQSQRNFRDRQQIPEAMASRTEETRRPLERTGQIRLSTLERRRRSEDQAC